MQNDDALGLNQNFQADTSAPSSEYAPITWTASEFIAHSKSASWYLLLGVIAIVFAGIVYALTRDMVSVVAISMVAILFGAAASRKPRDLTYVLSSTGLKVGEKMYSYSLFRSFSVVQEEGVQSIWFMPLQRFSPGLSIYLPPDVAQAIFSGLSQFLPFEERDTGPIDRLMHKIRF